MTEDTYKKALSPGERIKAAYLHHLRDVPQHDLAVAFEVNHGRVNEACRALGAVAEDPKLLPALIAFVRRHVDDFPDADQQIANRSDAIALVRRAERVLP